MGLDSVELLVSFERYFDIQIPDLEAEKISSVQDMVDCVSMHLNIFDPSTSLKTEIFQKLQSALIQIGLADHSFSLTDTISPIIDPDNKELWAKLSDELDLQIPRPNRGADAFVTKILFSLWQPKYNWRTLTTDEFITAICASNYKKLIDPTSIKNTFEILVAIIAITSDNLGIDIYEIQPHKRFVSDFGIS